MNLIRHKTNKVSDRQRLPFKADLCKDTSSIVF